VQKGRGGGGEKRGGIFDFRPCMYWVKDFRGWRDHSIRQSRVPYRQDNVIWHIQLRVGRRTWSAQKKERERNEKI